LKQDYEQAIAHYESARKLATKEGNSNLAVHFLMNIAACHQSLSSYRGAMEAYSQAISEARSKKLVFLETTTAINMASLLLEMGEDRSAGDLLLPYPLDGSTIPPDGRLQGFMMLSSVFTRLKRFDLAQEAFERALFEATKKPSPELTAAYGAQVKKWSESPMDLRRAWVYAMHSQTLIRLNKYEEAEPFVLEAFRLRTLFRDSGRLRELIQLAMIRRNRFDFEGATQLIETARKLDPKNRTPMLLFLLDREQARIELAKGSFPKALPFLRSALQRARSWRLEVIPSNATFLNFEANLSNEIQTAFLGAMLHPDFDLQQLGVASESLWMAEEARFASMRAIQFPAAEFSKRLPPEYWSTLTQFRRMQSNTNSADPSRALNFQKLETRLNLLESAAGLTIPHAKSDGLPEVSHWRQSLPSDDVVFSYYLSEPYSLAWTATSKGIAVRRIASRTDLLKLINQFRNQIINPSRNGNLSTGMELSKQLFGDYLYSHRTTPFWTMVLDQELSTLPIAALPGTKDGQRYLIEDHSLRVLPSAIFLRNEPTSDWTGNAIGIGDPVYNQADRRVSPAQNISLDLLQINRLPASSKELRRSLGVLDQNAWTTAEHTGLAATPDALRTALTNSPDILHLSAHFLPQTGSPHLLNIALSPASSTNRANLFSSLDLNSVRTQTKLVVLSGCSSSSGELVSSIAINGLSRAFLISGVSTVVATLWPTLDTDGPIFPVFYQHLVQQKWSPRAAAESLRAAQLQMIRQGGWTSRPAYWAAYIAISKG